MGFDGEVGAKELGELLESAGDVSLRVDVLAGTDGVKGEAAVVVGLGADAVMPSGIGDRADVTGGKRYNLHQLILPDASRPVDELLSLAGCV